MRSILRIVAAITILCVVFATDGYRPAPAMATTDWTVSRVEVSSQISGWPSSYLMDGDTGTRWSSEKESSASNAEWVAFWFDDYHSTNYIKIYPRYSGGEALAFPVDLNIQYSNGSAWVDVWTFEDFPVPQEDWIILPLGQTVTANGLRLNATQLGHDEDAGDFYFQLGEVAGGYDSGFETLELLDFDASGGYNEFDGMKAGPFDPNKLSEWHYDYRMPIHEATCSRKNIYSAQTLWNEATHEWYIYYGGNDSASDALCDSTHDRIFVQPTDGDFQTFDESESHMIIDRGSFRNVNNPALTKSPDGQWAMVYTAGWCDASYGTIDCRAEPHNDENNLTAYATSSDGITWSPTNPGDPFGTNTLLSVPNWHGGDWVASQSLNNQNGLLYDHGYYWYYYGPEGAGGRMYRAYSSDMANFTDSDDVVDSADGSVNDMKKFRYNGSEYYMMLAKRNADHVYYTVSTDPGAFPALQTLFSTTGVTESDETIAEDDYIVSAGIVADATTLYGILYGAADSASLDDNKIFAKWLQKKVYFSNEDVGYGSIERADGPDTVRLGLDGSNDIQTGNITIYDTNGSTVLFTSPEVTVISGMHWQYNGDESHCGLPRSGDWTISSDCTLSSQVVAPGDVAVENGATLTIESTGALDIDLEEYTLRVQHDSRVRIKNGGKID